MISKQKILWYISNNIINYNKTIFLLSIIYHIIIVCNFLYDFYNNNLLNIISFFLLIINALNYVLLYHKKIKFELLYNDAKYKYIKYIVNILNIYIAILGLVNIFEDLQLTNDIELLLYYCWFKNILIILYSVCKKIDNTNYEYNTCIYNLQNLNILINIDTHIVINNININNIENILTNNTNINVVKVKINNSILLKNEECIICLVDYNSESILGYLDCMHYYHYNCINEWLKIKKICPTCNYSPI